jgi:hypothetical protein
LDWLSEEGDWSGLNESRPAREKIIAGLGEALMAILD